MFASACHGDVSKEMEITEQNNGTCILFINPARSVCVCLSPRVRVCLSPRVRVLCLSPRVRVLCLSPRARVVPEPPCTC